MPISIKAFTFQNTDLLYVIVINDRYDTEKLKDEIIKKINEKQQIYM